MSEGHLLLKLGFELGIQLGQPYDGRPLIVETDRGLSLVWGLYRSQSRGLRNRYTRSFNIIGGPLL